MASFLSGLSFAVRTAIEYFTSSPPIIGSLFDVMRVEIIYTAAYFVLLEYFGVLFIYASHSHKKFNKKIFLVLCILPAIVSFIVLVSVPYIEYMMLTLIPSFLFIGLWLQHQCVIRNA